MCQRRFAASLRNEFLPILFVARMALVIAIGLLPVMIPRVVWAGTLAEDFVSPPVGAKTWVYWWWLNGYVSRDGIVRDLDFMQQQGISGALVFHAGTGWTPSSTTFMSQSWRDLFQFAVQEAAKRQITITLNICDGWNAGGPWVTSNDAARMLHTDVIAQSGPQSIDIPLPLVPLEREYFRELFVLAWLCDGPGGSCNHASMRDLSGQVVNGRLQWQVPAGNWRIVRFGSYVASRAYTKVTGGPAYLEIDPLSKAAMDLHFANTVTPLAQQLGPYLGTTFTHVHIDSSELGNPDWTEQMLAQFLRLRGYQPQAFLGAKAGLTIDDPLTTTRFLEDYSRTISDLWFEAYHQHFAELAASKKLKIHSESAGFQKPSVDALRVLGVSDIPMSEFWSRRSDGVDATIHQSSEADLVAHDGIKTASCAAEAYGKSIVQAEAFTVIRPDNYSVELFDLKDVGDRAYCEGMNRPVLLYFVHQPQSDDQAPGFTWPGVGTTFTRMDRWWTLGGAWVGYLNRCNAMLQRGHVVADVLYLQGEQTPSFVPAKWAMDPPLPAGMDMNVINSDVLIDRLDVDTEGRLVLPGGATYRYLALWQGGGWRKDRSLAASATGSGRPLELSPEAWTQIASLVQRGATLVGPPPVRAIGLADADVHDAAIAAIATTLWGSAPGASGTRVVGQGRVVWGTSLEALREADGLDRDLDISLDTATAVLDSSVYAGLVHPSPFDWIHRQDGAVDHYFIANLTNASAGGTFTFRAEGRLPELWDPMTGAMIAAPRYQRLEDGRVALPLDFAPRQSRFVVFRQQGVLAAASATREGALSATTIDGSWDVAFDPRWGGPTSTTFETLMDWSKHTSPGVAHYSGAATYHKTFTASATPAVGERLVLDLGEFYSAAQVELNGQDVGTRFAAPWRVDLTDAVVAGNNTLAITVANTWRNRVAADSALPKSDRLTYTNVLEDFEGTFHLHTLAEREAALAEPHPAGLIGPVTLAVVGQPPYNRVFADTFTPSRGKSRSIDDNLQWRTTGLFAVPRYREGRTTNSAEAVSLASWQTQLRNGKLQLSGDQSSGGSMVWAGPDIDLAKVIGPTYRIRFSVTPDVLPRADAWVAFTLGASAANRGAWVLAPHGGVTLLLRGNGEWLVVDGGNTVTGTTEGSTSAGTRQVELRVEDDGAQVSLALIIDGVAQGTFTALTTFTDENYLSFGGWIGDGLAAGAVVGHTIDDLEIVDTSLPAPTPTPTSPPADAGSSSTTAGSGKCDCQIGGSAPPPVLVLVVLLLLVIIRGQGWASRRRSGARGGR